MTGFSGREALGAGWRLIRRKPSILLVWGVVYVVLALIPQFAPVMLGWPDTPAFAEQGAQPTGAEMMRVATQQMLWAPVQMLGAMVFGALIYAACIRGVLEPENDRSAYIRFGREELWVGLVSVVMTVLFFMAALTLLIPAILIAAVGALASGAQPSVGLIVVAALLGLGAFGVLAWLGLRFSMALPMSYDEKAFRLFESWPMTRGLAFKIFLTYFAACLSAGLVFLAAMAVIGVIFLLAFVGLMVTAAVDPDQFASDAPLSAGVVMMALAAVLAGGLFISACTAAFYAVIWAPFADIYRQLKGSTASAS